MENGNTDAIVPKSRKLALFKKPPAWAKPVSSSSINEITFSLSENAYAREQEEKTRLKMGQTFAKAVKEDPQNEHVIDGHRSRKRQRVDGGASDSGESTSGNPASDNPTKR